MSKNSRRGKKSSSAKTDKDRDGGRGLSWGGPRKARSRWERPAIAVMALAAAAYFTWGWLEDRETERAFTALALAGEPLLEQRLQRFPNDGRRHLNPGETHRYTDRYPTSGPHSPIWTKPGIYDEPQSSLNLVHALEHGNIVIYLDAPGDAARAAIEAWAGLYGGQWDGIVVVPEAGLGEAVVLSAWRRRLRLERFDPELAAAFIERFRGRGPEHPVR